MIAALLAEQRRRNTPAVRARRAARDAVRRRIGALVADREAVAALAEAARAVRHPDVGAALDALAEALHGVEMATPEVLARGAPSDEDLATLLVMVTHNGMQRANPHRALGLAQSAAAPVARVLAALYALAGVRVEAGTLGRRIARGGYNIGPSTL